MYAPFSRNARIFRVLLAFGLAFAMFAPAAAQAPGTPSSGTVVAANSVTIAGTLVTQDNGLAIGNATVTLVQGGTTIAMTTSDGNGRWSFTNEPPGIYSVVVHALGYETTRVDDITALGGSTAQIQTALLRAKTESSSGLREIGATRATANGSTLASTTTIQYDLDPDQLQSQGYLKAADAIGQIPGVNITGGPHSVGDDTSIDFRGLGAGEVRPRLLRLCELTVFSSQ